jgi:hypothetical protein
MPWKWNDGIEGQAGTAASNQGMPAMRAMPFVLRAVQQCRSLSGFSVRHIHLSIPPIVEADGLMSAPSQTVTFDITSDESD